MKYINGQLFKQMLQSGAANLSNHHAEIDALNVFPVPDGDTGTNMSMTFTSGVKDALAVCSDEIPVIAKALSKGLLMGARGNSGVITSQIFRGLYQSIDKKETLNAADLAAAFSKGSEVAYKAVMKPVEGTILTVIRESSYYAEHLVNPEEMEVEEWFKTFIDYAKESLNTTPDLLPVLKEVGVVDSGGAGLIVILEGMYSALLGNVIEAHETDTAASAAAMDVENDEFGYCTEFILRLNDHGMRAFTEDKLKRKLSQIGESIVVVQDEELVKVHVHTLTPGEALNLAQRYGEFVKLKIENMQEQHSTLQSEAAAPAVEAPAKEYALIAVAAGEGLTNLFKEYRCDVVISGGQTMNPSTEDFVAAINKLNAKHILILPNNSNIILAAQQAAVVLDDRDIHVLPSKSIPQGLSACLMFNPEADVEGNLEEMTEAIKNVKTGQVTYAIKDTTYEGLEIKEGDYMGMFEKSIIVAVPDKMQAVKTLVDQMVDEDAEIVTLIAGEDASEEEVEELVAYIEDNYDAEVDLHRGDQPVYCFVLGVE
ncbi:MAG: DAK2 domain-containing protein [Erysipelotrichaceae bacterium]|nr:DAK2 domain-containing protein [Erysipelotrichaceae bacterium]